MTDDGRRFAVLYTKLANYVVASLFATDQPNAPAPLTADRRLANASDIRCAVEVL